MKPYSTDDRETEGAVDRCDAAIKSDTWGTPDEYQCRNRGKYQYEDGDGNIRLLCAMHNGRSNWTFWHLRAANRDPDAADAGGGEM